MGRGSTPNRCPRCRSAGLQGGGTHCSACGWSSTPRPPREGPRTARRKRAPPEEPPADLPPSVLSVTSNWPLRVRGAGEGERGG